MKEDKSKTRILIAYYKNAAIVVKKLIWKKQRFVKPIQSSVVWDNGKYKVYLTFAKYGEISCMTKEDGEWGWVANRIDKAFARKLKKVI